MTMATSAALAARRPFATLQALLLALAVPGCVADCSSPVVTGGLSYQWPVVNPAVVAPVSARFAYQPYAHPLRAEFTGTAISIAVPPNLVAGFNLTDASGTAQRQFALTSIELRKPGRVPEGASQVLSHVLEAALVHREVGGNSTSGPGIWASVVVPFNVASDADGDILSVLLSDAALPRRYGQRDFVLLDGAARALDLSSVFQGANFSAYWTTLPTDCDGTEADSMQLVRSASVATSQGSFQQLLRALSLAPAALPVVPPAVTFLMGTCNSSATSCTPLVAESLTSQLTQAQTVQGTAVQELRTRKGLMDQALLELQNGTANSYPNAVQARTALRNADAQLTGAMTAVQRLQGWINQAGNATWQSSPPAAANTTANTSAATAATSTANTTSPATSTANATSPATSAANATSATNATNGTDATDGEDANQLSADVAANAAADAAAAAAAAAANATNATNASTPASSNASASSAPASPSAPAANASANASALLEASACDVSRSFANAGVGRRGAPLRFTETAGDTAGLLLRVTKAADHVRIAAPHHGSPLGAIAVPDGGPARSFSFADIRAAPPGRSLRGKADGAAVVLELVHMPHDNRPATTAVVHLDLVPDGVGRAGGNRWLEPVVAALDVGSSEETYVRGAPIAELLAALQTGTVDRYLLFDGALVGTPCRAAERYVLEERGTISSRQLSTLLKASPGSSAKAEPQLAAQAESVAQSLAQSSSMVAPERHAEAVAGGSKLRAALMAHIGRLRGGRAPRHTRQLRV